MAEEEKVSVNEGKTTESPTPSVDEFDINNLEVLKVANYFDLKYDDLIERGVSDKLHSIWRSWEKDSKDKGFYEYVRDLNSKLGYKPGVHPLDKIYTYLTLLEEEGKKKQEKKLLREKKKIIREKSKIEKERQLIKEEMEAFKEKVNLVRKLLKKL